MRLLRPYAAHQQRINTQHAPSHWTNYARCWTERLRMQEDDRQRAGALREDARLGAPEPTRWSDAAAATPYMADDRIARIARIPELGDDDRLPRRARSGDGYRGFEDLFRGSEQMIRDPPARLPGPARRPRPAARRRLRPWRVPRPARRARHRRRAAWTSTRSMVERCHEKGHENVEEGDLLDVLERRRAGLAGRDLQRPGDRAPADRRAAAASSSSAVSRLRPGGLLIAETVNPHSPAALKAFWVDPTHKVTRCSPRSCWRSARSAATTTGDVFAPLGTGDWERGPHHGRASTRSSPPPRAQTPDHHPGLPRGLPPGITTGGPIPSRAGSSFASWSTRSSGCSRAGLSGGRVGAKAEGRSDPIHERGSAPSSAMPTRSRPGCLRRAGRGRRRPSL